MIRSPLCCATWVYGLCCTGCNSPRRNSYFTGYWLGAVTGIACLVKQSCLMLVPLAGLSLSFYGWNNRINGKFPLGEVIITLGFSYGVHGVDRYAAGGISAMQCCMATSWAPDRITPPMSRWFSFGLREVWDSFTSYWACFGWQVLNLPDWIYLLLLCGTLLALGSLLLNAMRNRRVWLKDTRFWQAALILASLLGMNLVAFVRWAIATGAPYGRLLFPSIVTTALLFSGGLHSFKGKMGIVVPSRRTGGDD